MVETHRVVDRIVGYLAANGVSHIFGVDGANIEDLYDAAYFVDDITAVLAKHEFSAATMADGVQPQRRRNRRGGGNIGWRLPQHRARTGRIAGQPGSRAGPRSVQAPTTLDGHGAFQDTSGDNGSLDGHALVLGGLGVLPQGADTRPTFSPRFRRRWPPRTGGPRGVVAAQEHSAGRAEGRTVRPMAAAMAVAGAASGRTRHSDLGPLERALRGVDGPITIIAGEQVARDDARAELERLRATLRARIGHGARRQRRGRHPGVRLVLRVGGSRCDGSSRGVRCRRPERDVPRWWAPA